MLTVCLCYNGSNLASCLMMLISNICHFQCLSNGLLVSALICLCSAEQEWRHWRSSWVFVVVKVLWELILYPLTSSPLDRSVFICKYTTFSNSRINSQQSLTPSGHMGVLEHLYSPLHQHLHHSNHSNFLQLPLLCMDKMDLLYVGAFMAS